MGSDNFKSDNKSADMNQSVGGSFLEFLTITVKYRRFLFWFIFIITVSATAYALLAPKWYKSVSSVLPAERTDFLSGLSGIGSLAKNFSASKGLSALAGGDESDKYLAILMSATITDEVIVKYELRKEYDLEDAYYEKVVKEYQSNVDFEIEDEGNLTITVYDKDPQQAADMCNYMVMRLNEINTNLSVTNAKANREFIAKRYFQNLHEIDSLELAMRDFQLEYGILSMPDQIESSVKAMTEIYATLAEKEIQYSVLTRTYSADNPIIGNTLIEIEELRKKIDLINSGTDPSQKEVSLMIPFKKAPELGNEFIKIYRSLEVQYKILEIVTPLYEQAKVEEIRNTPSVLVLDVAKPADRKAKPKGTLYALISFVSSLLIGYLIILLLELFEKMKLQDPKRHSFIFDSLKSDLVKLRFKKKV